MGKGISLQFKQAFPENFRDYERACKKGKVRLGKMFVHATGQYTNPRLIINFPTKQHWKARSRLEDIRAGLDDLVEVVRNSGIKSLALPPLGCGNGGLNWDEVCPLITQAFADLPEVLVLLYAPQPTPDAEAMPVGTKRPNLTRARALLILLIDRYRGPGYRVTKLEIQKLAYFLQLAGERMRLKFAKQTYGPYAENLNHALRDMEGHFLRGFGDRTANSSIHLMPGAVEEAQRLLGEDKEAQERLERVSQLIAGFENPYGMELLSTIHWVASEDLLAASDPTVAVQLVHAWSERKKATFRVEHITKAWAHLTSQQWLPKASS